jgi:5'-3' exonuclease
MVGLTVVIDTSYYLFHRFFATYRWYSIRKDLTESNGLVVDDPDFLTAFYRHLENDFKTIRTKYEYDDWIWLAIDCPRNDIWRQDIFPDYKATRTHAKHFDGSIFPKVYEYLKTEKERLKLRFVCHPRLEADDICFVLFKTLDMDKLIIIANDNDYLQICSDKVDVINKEGKYIKERGCGDPRKDLMKKVLMGDKSDNIPSVCKGVGPKTVEKLLSMTAEDMDDWIAAKGGTPQYELNKKLICFENIPYEYMCEVTAEVQKMKSI